MGILFLNWLPKNHLQTFCYESGVKSKSLNITSGTYGYEFSISDDCMGIDVTAIEFILDSNAQGGGIAIWNIVGYRTNENVAGKNVVRFDFNPAVSSPTSIGVSNWTGANITEIHFCYLQTYRPSEEAHCYCNKHRVRA